MYVAPNFKTKRDLKAAVAAGKRVEVFSAGLGSESAAGRTVSVEGPHYPAMHAWYARVKVSDEGRVVKVLS